MLEEGRHTVNVMAQETVFCRPRTHASRLPPDLRRAGGGIAQKRAAGSNGGQLTRYLVLISLPMKPCSWLPGSCASDGLVVWACLPR